MDNQSKHILLSYLFEDAASAKKLKSLSDKISAVHQDHKLGFEKAAKKKLKDAGFSEVKTGKDSCIYQKIDGDTVHTVKLDKHSPSMNYSNSNGRTSSYYHHIEHDDSHIDKGLAQMVYGGSMYEGVDDLNQSRRIYNRAKKAHAAGEISHERLKQLRDDLESQKRKLTKESEDISEISKQTLKSYIRRASDDRNFLGYREGRSAGKDERRAMAATKKDANRREGILRAVGRLTKESEEISEISRNTLSRYLAKTQYDYDGVRKSSRELAGKKKWGGTGNLPSAKVPAGDK
jgi:hypothetical protein